MDKKLYHKITQEAWCNGTQVGKSTQNQVLAIIFTFSVVSYFSSQVYAAEMN